MTNDYPDAFDSDDKSKESLLLLSNMGAIRERLEEDAKEKENIISQRLQKYLEAQANNLHNLIMQLSQDLEKEKNRIKDADLNKISEQLKEYEKLSDKIETNFKEEYDTFVLNFIKDIKNRLNNALKKSCPNG
ncbi:ATP/GTP-binding protein [Helicobacter pylori]|nr:ATP/GTP-binding protein [Helicobacter pylori]